MTRPPKTTEFLAAENAELLRRLEEAEETLRAIRRGDVDALVVAESTGHRIYTLEGADRPYRLLVEQMQQGAATLHENGMIAYCNRRTAELLDVPLGAAVGSRLLDFVAAESAAAFTELLQQGRTGIARGEVLLECHGRKTSVLMTLNALPADCGASIGVLLTDLTLQKHHDHLATLLRALHESEARLQRQANQLGAFLETAAIGLRRIGPDGVILWANDAELQTFGYAAEEYIGRHFADFHADRSAAEAFLAHLRDGGTVRDRPARIRCRDGSLKHVLIDSSVLWENARFLHTQCFTRDVTQRIEAEERLRASEAVLREADNRKNQFLAMLSHELRNPLAPILHATHLLRLQAKGDESQIQRQAREIIERQTSTIAKLVNDLLDIARLTNGRIQLHRQPVDLRQIVGHAIETIVPGVRRNGHQLESSLPDHGVWVDGDATRLEEVVVNILNNAVKYTPDGGRISVALEEDGVDALIRVQDSGVGMGPDVLPHVFELFTQADRSLARSQGGLGIGLHLVQWLVDLHGGKVTAHSAGANSGSEFVVRLPLRSPPAAPEAAAPTPSHFDRGAVRVLVVDDNVDCSASLATFLRLQGYGVQTVHSGTLALQTARSARPDVVLLDIGLPGMSGYEVAQHLRREFTQEVMRLVAITGYGRDDDVRLAREAGFDMHFLKPVDPVELDRVIAAWKSSPSAA